MQTQINQYSVLDNRFTLGFKSFVRSLNLYLEKKKQRKQLLQLEDYLLNDIGVTRQQAIDEASL